MAKLKCKKCGDEIPQSEIKQYQEENGGDLPMELICEDCFQMLENACEQYDEHSDADMGL